MSRSSLQKLTPSVCRKEAVLTDVTSSWCQGLSYKNAPLDFTPRKVNLWPLTWFPGPKAIWGDVTTYSEDWGKWPSLTVDFYVLTARRKQDLIWTTSRYKYLQRASPTIAPSPIAMSHCRAMSQQHPVPYSRTLVRRRIKCHFDSFPIWSKFLVDKMQMRAIIWQVIWWCRRYGGYA